MKLVHVGRGGRGPLTGVGRGSLAGAGRGPLAAAGRGPIAAAGRGPLAGRAAVVEDRAVASAPGGSEWPAVARDSVAVVIPERANVLFGDPFFADVLRGISAVLAESDLQLVLLMPQCARDTARARAHLIDGRIGGAIIVAMHGEDPLPAWLVEHGIPTVISGQPPRGVAASGVDCDNRTGAALAVGHLLALGRRRIATISGNLDMVSAVDRRLGYRETLLEAGIDHDPTLEEVADYVADRAVMAMERLLLNHPDVEGVFAASDQMASAAMQVLLQARRRVPDDVAVVGFDDSPIARMTQPQLSSIRQPIEEMGAEMARIVVREMGGIRREPSREIFVPELVIRESSFDPGPRALAS